MSAATACRAKARARRSPSSRSLRLLTLWWVATHAGWIRDLFLPTPERIITSFADAWKGDIQGGRPLYEHFGWSMFRVFAAFVLACVTAIPVGIAMGVSRIARGIFDPPIEFYRPLPPLAYLPLIVIWFGIEETAKVVLIYLACFAPLAMAARAGVKSVMIEQINAAYSMGASKWQVIRHVIMPAAMPEIFTGMRIAIGFGWTTLVAAEMVAANGRARPDGAQRVELPAHRRRDHGHRRHRRRRLRVRSADALHRARGRAVEGSRIVAVGAEAPKRARAACSTG